MLSTLTAARLHRIIQSSVSGGDLLVVGMPVEFSRKLRGEGYVVYTEPLPQDWSQDFDDHEKFETVFIYIIDATLATERWRDAFTFAAKRSSSNIFVGFCVAGGAPLIRTEVEKFGLAHDVRKHPAYYDITPYNSLDFDHDSIVIPFQRLRPKPYSIKPEFDSKVHEKLALEDMTRIASERSDAALFQYHFVTQYLRKGDIVLDVFCGTGYGTWLMAALSSASKVIGIDVDDAVLEYAQMEFLPHFQNRLGYVCGTLELENLANNEYDLVTCFQSLDQIVDVDRFLQSVQRVLRPGGRFVVAVMNANATTTSSSLNGSSTFSWEALRSILEKYFIPERAMAQCGGHSDTPSRLGRWATEFDFTLNFEERSDWCVAVVMKSPLQGTNAPEFDNRQYGPPLAPTWHLTRFAEQYNNPWIVPSVIQHGALRPWRIRSVEERVRLAESMLRMYSKESADYAAAAAVLGHVVLETASSPADDIYRHIEQIDAYLSAANVEQPIHTRWIISLLFLKARLLESINELDEAIKAYRRCCSISPHNYGPAIATKTISSYLHLGYHYAKQRDYSRAETAWREGVEVCRSATRDSGWLAAVGDVGYPDAIGLFELMDVVGLAQKCAACLEQLRQGAPDLPVTVWRLADNNKDAWLRERDIHIMSLADSLARTERIVASMNEIAATSR